MKGTDFSKLKAATTVGPFETEALFSNEVTSFPECLTKKSYMCNGNKTQTLEIYNSNCMLAIPKIKPTATVIDLSVVVCVKAVVTGTKHANSFRISCYIVFKYTVGGNKTYVSDCLNNGTRL